MLIAGLSLRSACQFLFFFFNDTATTEIYTLSLHDALPISRAGGRTAGRHEAAARPRGGGRARGAGSGGRAVRDRKSTRLNSSHLVISYAVFCLKKKKNPPRSPICASSTQCWRLHATVIYCP